MPKPKSKLTFLMELNKLTGAQIVLIVLSENNQVHKYLSDPLKPLETTNLYHDIKALSKFFQIRKLQDLSFDICNFAYSNLVRLSASFLI